MKKFAKKTLALVLTVMLMVGLTAVGVSAAAAGFTDTADTPYAQAVNALAEAGIIKGYSASVFGVNDPVTRGQAVTMLGRMVNAEEKVGSDFSDVPAGAYYAGYVGWAADNGVVEGYGNGIFGPDDSVTGYQLDLMLERVAKLVGVRYTAANTSNKPLTRGEVAVMIYVLFAQLPKTGEASTNALVDVEAGRYMGTKEDGVYRFVGIQYGVAERFHSATKAPAFPGIHTATTYGGASPSSQQAQNPGKTDPLVTSYMTPNAYWAENEDCLYLNVWSDALNNQLTHETTSATKPVLVFIHGGGLSTGSGNELTYYDGANFAKETGAVFVSVNHRLNILGYGNLSAYGDEYKPNLGQEDLILALEWVRDNIAQFGGDPNNVTILGQSGGGSKVTGLLSSARALPLFDKAVICSGGPSEITATKESTQDVGTQWVENAKKTYGLTTDAEALEKLETIPYDELCEVTGGATAGIVIDGDIVTESAYKADGTWSENSKDVPLIISSTFAEMAGSMANNCLSALVNGMTDGMAAGGAPIKDTYVGTTNMDYMTEEYKREQIEAVYGGDTDAAIAAFQAAYPGLDPFQITRYNGRGTDKAALARVNSGAANTYVCMWAYEFPIFGGTMAWHTGGDLPFFFQNMSFIPGMIAGDEIGAQKLADDSSAALLQFMKTGNPGTADLPWAAFTAGEGAVMVFSDDSVCRTGHYDADLQALKDAHSSGSGFPS